MAAEVPPDVDFKIPNWAGKPPVGLHLDVMKGDKLIQKLMIDEKRCYFFGRNPKTCDFAVDHASCSRVHAALVYHKHLNRLFLIDLSSMHGTYIGTVRLEATKPEHVQIDQSFHFGASTRRYIVRERPSGCAYAPGAETEDLTSGAENKSAHLFGLPEKEEELENLTEYNTALNRRMTTMPYTEEEFKSYGAKRKHTKSVKFKDDEDVINPEDVDPSVGKFRNMVQTTVIPTKRHRLEFEFDLNNESSEKMMPMPGTPLTITSTHLPGFGPISAKLSMSLPHIAPDVDLYPTSLPAPAAPSVGLPESRPTPTNIGAKSRMEDNEPRKKRYAKEAWPGKKSGPHLLV